MNVNPPSMETSFPGALKVGALRSEASGKAFEDALRKADASLDDKGLKEACEQFEAYFIQMAFREMRKTSFSTKGREEAIFMDMLDEERAKGAAKSQTFGLAEMMAKQIKRQGASGKGMLDMTIE
jgi:flagellar protein FlgJ